MSERECVCVWMCVHARAHTHTHTHNAPAGWSGASHEPKAGVLDLRSLVAATEVRVGWFLLYSFTYTLSLIFRNREHLTYKDTIRTHMCVGWLVLAVLS